VFGTTATAFVLPALYPFGDSITTSQAQFSERAAWEGQAIGPIGTVLSSPVMILSKALYNRAHAF
jgi:hypothetical protein